MVSTGAHAAMAVAHAARSGQICSAEGGCESLGPVGRGRRLGASSRCSPVRSASNSIVSSNRSSSPTRSKPRSTRRKSAIRAAPTGRPTSKRPVW
eukprot:scaffold33164_cov59-Phaeocystis_antarctica.AAC.3